MASIRRSLCRPWHSTRWFQTKLVHCIDGHDRLLSHMFYFAHYLVFWWRFGGEIRWFSGISHQGRSKWAAQNQSIHQKCHWIVPFLLTDCNEIDIPADFSSAYRSVHQIPHPDLRAKPKHRRESIVLRSLRQNSQNVRSISNPELRRIHCIGNHMSDHIIHVNWQARANPSHIFAGHVLRIDPTLWSEHDTAANHHAVQHRYLCVFRYSVCHSIAACHPDDRHSVPQSACNQRHGCYQPTIIACGNQIESAECHQIA